MADQFSQYEVKPTDDFSQYEVKSPVDEPGWFQPGSKSEALVRGAAQGATLGMGNKIQAYLRAIPADGDTRSYLERARELEDDQREANAASQAANPKTFLAGNIVGSLPAGASIARAATIARSTVPGIAGKLGTIAGSAAGAGSRGALQGAIQGVGQSKSDFSDLPESVAKQAAIGGVTSGVVAPLALGASKLLQDKVLGSAVKKWASGPEAAAPVASTTIANQLTLPGLGALGNMAYKNYGGDPQETDWATDPYSAAINTAKAGAQGALAGAAVKGGLRLGGAAGQAALKQTGKVLGSAANVMSNFGERSASNAAQVGAAAPFTALNEYLKSNSNEHLIQQAAEEAAQLDDGTPEGKRQAAAKLQSSAAGRAVTNESSPLRD